MTVLSPVAEAAPSPRDDGRDGRGLRRPPRRRRERGRLRLPRGAAPAHHVLVLPFLILILLVVVVVLVIVVIVVLVLVLAVVAVALAVGRRAGQDDGRVARPAVSPTCHSQRIGMEMAENGGKAPSTFSFCPRSFAYDIIRS